LFAVVGGFLAYRSIDLNLILKFTAEELLLNSLKIPFGMALGTMLATLFQSKFLFRPGTAGRNERTGYADFFYALVKFFLVLSTGAFLYRRLLADLTNGKSGVVAILFPSIGACSVLLVVFALVGIWLSRLVFDIKHSMSKDEMAAESREGEMRPEMRAAADRFIGDE
jgi:hypothetical protein